MAADRRIPARSAGWHLIGQMLWGLALQLGWSGRAYDTHRAAQSSFPKMCPRGDLNPHALYGH